MSSCDLWPPRTRGPTSVPRQAAGRLLPTTDTRSPYRLSGSSPKLHDAECIGCPTAWSIGLPSDPAGQAMSFVDVLEQHVQQRLALKGVCP